MSKIAQQIPYYIPILAIFVLAFLGFTLFPFDRRFQIAVLVAAGAAHVVWGIVYHYIHKDLTFTLILEYIVIATFGVAAVLTTLG